MAKRRTMKREGDIQNIEYREVCKTLRKKIREDCRKYNTAVITDKIRNNKSVKKGRREVSEGTNRISCVLSKAGQPITNQNDILKRIEEFYTDLYASADRDPIRVDQAGVTSELLDITSSEVRHALGNMSNDKAVGADGISVEAMKAGGAFLHGQLAKLFTNCLRQNITPDNWKSSKMVLIHKKGDNRNLKNYRPISLLSNVYKLYTKVLTNRLQHQLDDNQPPEQAGFRSGFSTMDHIHAINQLREKCAEYQRPLCIALVDFEKAFDSVETRAVLTSLGKQGIQKEYINSLAEIYAKGYATTTLHKESDPIPIRKGVRQGDTISPKLFTACLEDIFRDLDWELKGIPINGKRLNNLRFADDVALIAESMEDIEICLNELTNASKARGLRINMEKTKLLRNPYARHGNVKIGNTTIEEVGSYVYLGQTISLQNRDMSSEVSRRIQAGWRAFREHADILKGKIPMSLKRKLYHQCVLPAMTYGSESWTMTKAMEHKLHAAQRNMERSMLGITWADRMTNEWIRLQTKVKDILDLVKERKWKWAGHVSRMSDNRWTILLTDWRPRDGHRKRGRPSKRWRDELDHYWRTVAWKRYAQDRGTWKQHTEAFIQQVD
jgi:hypothetical protein